MVIGEVGDANPALDGGQCCYATGRVIGERIESSLFTVAYARSSTSTRAIFPDKVETPSWITSVC